MFFFDTHTPGELAEVSVLGMPFHPRLIFAGAATVYKSGALYFSHSRVLVTSNPFYLGLSVVGKAT